MQVGELTVGVTLIELENEDLVTVLERRTRELEETREANKALRTQITEVVRDRDQAIDTIGGLNRACAAMRRECDELETEVKELRGFHRAKQVAWCLGGGVCVMITAQEHLRVSIETLTDIAKEAQGKAQAASLNGSNFRPAQCRCQKPAEACADEPSRN